LTSSLKTEKIDARRRYKTLNYVSDPEVKAGYKIERALIWSCFSWQYRFQTFIICWLISFLARKLVEKNIPGVLLTDGIQPVVLLIRLY